jgi:hypothetical protein
LINFKILSGRDKSHHGRHHGVLEGLSGRDKSRPYIMAGMYFGDNTGQSQQNLQKVMISELLTFCQNYPLARWIFFGQQH